MHTLPVSAFNIASNLNPPDSAGGFENICADVFPVIQKQRGIELINKAKSYYTVHHGTNGDRQNGVDLKDYGSYATAQCKNVQGFSKAQLKKEIGKLRKYDNQVSAHFFILSLDRVPVALQQYIEHSNAQLEFLLQVERKFPAKPAEYIPHLYIISWSEVKSILSSNTYLSLKWGVLPGISSHYPYLQGLNIDSLSKSIDEIGSRKSSSGRKSLEAVDAISDMIKSLGNQSFEALGVEAEIKSSVLDSVYEFIKCFERVVEVASEYHISLENCGSRDLVVMARGLKQLNEIAMFQARIEAIPYLRVLYAALDFLNRELNVGGKFEWGVMEYENEWGESRDCEDASKRIYNFKGDYESLEYIDPRKIVVAARKVLAELGCLNARAEQIFQ